LLLYGKGEYKGAEALFRRALKGICKISCKIGGTHPYLKTIINNYAVCLQNMGMNEIQVRQRLESILKPCDSTRMIS